MHSQALLLMPSPSFFGLMKLEAPTIRDYKAGSTEVQKDVDAGPDHL